MRRHKDPLPSKPRISCHCKHLPKGSNLAGKSEDRIETRNFHLNYCIEARSIVHIVLLDPTYPAESGTGLEGHVRANSLRGIFPLEGVFG